MPVISNAVSHAFLSSAIDVYCQWMDAIGKLISESSSEDVQDRLFEASKYIETEVWRAIQGQLDAYAQRLTIRTQQKDFSELNNIIREVGSSLLAVYKSRTIRHRKLRTE